ncbi:MAG: PrgI family protein [Patescibacteria group bacterium]
MEQHPIPQNISGFQFKLIGDITLKQFAYCAGGVLIAYLATKVTLLPTLLRYPIAGFLALLGFGLAFVPIEERPLDRWLMSFIRRMYAPTQYIWKKSNPPPEILFTLPMTKATVTPPAVPTTPPKPVPPKPVPPPKMNPVPKQQAARVPPKPIPPVQPPPKRPDWWAIGAPPPPKSNFPITPATTTSNVTGKRVVFEEKKPEVKITPQTNPKQVEQIKSEYKQKTEALSTQISRLQEELAQGALTKDRLMELQQVLTQLLTEKERLSGEVGKLRQQMQDQQKSAIERPSQYTKVDTDPRTTVKIVSAGGAVRAGIPTLTSYPNVITGIIKDGTGIQLPGLIITVKDKDGVPVRALKTNKLGQFAASTPLANGTYLIEVEDPKNKFQFNRIEVSLSGLVLPPLEISAVSQRDIIRAKLTQEIFGKNTL